MKMVLDLLLFHVAGLRNMNRFLTFLIVILLLLNGCTGKVEIPNNHAGIIIDKDSDQVKSEVLRSGEHTVNFNSAVIVYELNPVSFETETGFMFKDVIDEGTFKVAVEFTPVVDSLSSFYKRYQSTYLSPVVEIETRRLLRKLLYGFNRDQYSKEELELRIVQAITTNYPLLNYVHIDKVKLVKLEF